jgi:uncharacterized protein (DUF488 family)
MRGFADYMATPAFRTAFDALLTLASERSVAIFCAETLWWSCHRKLIADAAVLLAETTVMHLSSATKSTHVLTPSARKEGDMVVYPATMRT